MIEIKITTSKFVERQLKRVESEIAKKVDTAIFKAANLVRNSAVRGIQGGKKTGRVYTRRTVKHRASAPGEYPASDTGRLANSIRIDRGFLEADVGSDVIYSKFLEPDNLTSESKLKPRPFLEPSYKQNEANIRLLIDEAVAKAFE